METRNIRAHHDCEGLFYLDKNLLDVYRKVVRCGECGQVKSFDWSIAPKTARELQFEGINYSFCGEDVEWHCDFLESQQNWQDMEDYMCTYILDEFCSFRPVAKWHGYRGARVLLENAVFKVLLADNGWSAVWCLLLRENLDPCCGFRHQFHQPYSAAIRTALLTKYGEVIDSDEAWKHGKIYQLEVSA